jgi:uncharacterized protein (TIGR02598 family)
MYGDFRCLKRNLDGLETSMRRRTELNSFTLVEVVIAIAIISFVLISILGLMAFASQQVKQADTYARLSNVSGQILARLESQSYAATSAAANTNAVYYFTFDGLPTNSTSAYYQCNITNYPPTASNVTNLMIIQLSIRYPTPQFTSTNLITTSILNYD